VILTKINELSNITHCGQILPNLISHTERVFGNPLKKMPPEMRRQVIKMLLDLGAFELRGAAVKISKEMGISRAGLYSILKSLQ
jgi:predicted transcriptional regulator YheO